MVGLRVQPALPQLYWKGQTPARRGLPKESQAGPRWQGWQPGDLRAGTAGLTAAPHWSLPGRCLAVTRPGHPSLQVQGQGFESVQQGLKLELSELSHMGNPCSQPFRPAQGTTPSQDASCKMSTWSTAWRGHNPPNYHQPHYLAVALLQARLTVGAEPALGEDGRHERGGVKCAPPRPARAAAEAGPRPPCRMARALEVHQGSSQPAVCDPGEWERGTS